MPPVSLLTLFITEVIFLVATSFIELLDAAFNKLDVVLTSSATVTVPIFSPSATISVTIVSFFSFYLNSTSVTCPSSSITSAVFFDQFHIQYFL